MFVQQPVRGMRDILPAEMEIRNRLLSVLRETYASFGYRQIETPCVEHLSNLTSRQGGDNEKLIFRILKRGEKLQAASDSDDLADSGLRYDLTVPLARYYAAHQNELTLPFKALQIGPVWRADRPQRGRYRQFTQCDIDILGEPGAAAEIELIYATARFLGQVGVRGCTVLLNDRRLLRAMAQKSGFSDEEAARAFIILDKADKIGADGVRREMLSSDLAAAQVEKYLQLYADFAAATDRFAWCRKHLADVLDESVTDNLQNIFEQVTELANGRFAVDFDPSLVRGMAYYTGTIFEVVSTDFPGSSIAGGGRYDEMIGLFTGQAVSACGFSIGFERLVGALLERGSEPAKAQTRIAVLYTAEFPPQSLALLQARCQVRRDQGAMVLLLRQNKNQGYQRQQLAADGYTDIRVIRSQADLAALWP